MPVREFTKELRGFAGLNTQSPNNLIDDRELQVCDNYMVGLQGELVKRPGLEKLNDTTFTSGINLLIALANPNTAALRIFAGQNGLSTNYYSDNGTTWTALGTAKSNITWAANLGSKLFFGNDSTGVHEYNWGTNALAALTSSPNGLDGIVFKQRLFVLQHHAVNPGRIQFSEPYGAAVGGLFSGAAAWPSTNTIDIESHPDGDFIVAMIPINDVLYIFKRTSIWALYIQGSSPADWILRKIHNSLGCVHKGGVAQFGNLTYFRSQNGIFRTDGSNFQELSESIRDAVRLPQGYFYSYPANTGSQRPLRYKDYILFPTFISATSDRTIWCYNSKTGAWSKWSPSHPTGLFYSALSITNGSPNVATGIYLGGENSSGTANILYGIREGAEVTQDHSTTFTASMRTKEFDFNNLDEFKRIHWIGTDVYAQKVDLEYTADDAASANPTSTDIVQIRRFVKGTGPGSCRRISIAIDDDGDGFQSRIHGIVIQGSVQSEMSKVSTK